MKSATKKPAIPNIQIPVIKQSRSSSVLPGLKNSTIETPLTERPAKKKFAFKPFEQKDTFICRFCGGRTCKHENWMTYPDSAIKGLNSDWITNTILATQRPSTRLIKEFDIIKQFKDKGINAIFNLQEPGEHPSCGDGIHPASGFSYYPEEFYDNGIYFFNFGWRDMTATSTDVVLKILKQMSFSLANGNKVAVHCHAGRGRTGLIIAAWLIYNDNMSAKEAIKHIRERRKEAISKKSQEVLLHQFEKEVKESRQIFFSSPKYGLDEYLFHQKKLYALISNSAERYVPKIVLVVLERLETMIKSNICRIEDVLCAFYSLNERQSFKENWTNNHEKFLKTFKDRINGNHYEVSDIEDPRYLVQILLEFFEGFATPPIDQRFLDAIYLKIHETNTKLTKKMKDQFFKDFNKKEFFLLECFARFFAGILALSENTEVLITRAVLRVCISLVSARKKLDKLFLKRNMIGDHNDDDKVTHLKIFVLKWVENFNEEFSQNFVLQKSVLRINEKKIREKLIKKGLQAGSYLSKVLDPNKAPQPDQEELSSFQPSSFSNVPDDDEEEEEKQENGGHPAPITLPTPRTQYKIHVQGNNLTKPIKARDSTKPKGRQDLILKISDTHNSADIKANLTGESSMHETPRGVKLPNIVVNNQQPQPNILVNGNTSTPNKSPGSMLAPLTPGRGPRKSLLKTDDHEKIQEGVSAQAKINIERHYDNFFASNNTESKETITDGGSKDSVSDSSDTKQELPEGNEQNGHDDVEDMIQKIVKMNSTKQDMIVRKLLELQSARNNDTKKLVS